MEINRKFGNPEFSKEQFYLTYPQIGQTVSDKSSDYQIEPKILLENIEYGISNKTHLPTKVGLLSRGELSVSVSESKW